MKNARIISPSDIRLYYFGSKDVLFSRDEKETRKKKLQHAVRVTHNEQVPVNIYMKLPTGETLKTKSDKVDYSDGVVIIKGGFAIPVSAILDIDAA